VNFDPTKALFPAPNAVWESAIYDTLLHRDARTGAFTPGLATKALVVNPTTVNISLRPGVTFSDGTPFNADAVKFGLLRNKSAPQHGQFSSSLQQISAIDITDPLDLTIHFSTPVAGLFYDQLSLWSTYIVSPAAAQKPGANLDAAPVGAGPYKLQSYVPDQRITLVKNPTYWDAKDIHLAGIDIVAVSVGPDEVNTLEAGTVDAVYLAQPQFAKALQSRYPVDSPSSRNFPLKVEICKSSSPLNNAQVRQALNYAIDGNQINQTVLQGLGVPMSGLWSQGSPYYDPSLANMYTYNPQKAKQLLSAAGYPNGFRATVVVTPGPSQQAFQIIQQEWAAVGVKVTPITSQNSIQDLFVRHIAPLGITGGTAAGAYGPLIEFTPGVINNLCKYNDPTLDGLYTAAEAVNPTSPQGIALLRRAQDYIYQQALAVFVVQTPLPVAHTPRVHNLVVNPYYGGGSTSTLDLWSGMYISK
jgi:peptide/nickel transport system substrate-binding protein